LVEGRDRGRAVAAAAEASEVEQPTERIRGGRAEQVLPDFQRRPQWLVWDARRVPHEEVLAAELGRVRPGDAVEHPVEKGEEIAHVEDGAGIVGARRLHVAAAFGRLAGADGGALHATEDALARSGTRIEAVVADRRRELAAQQRAVPTELVPR